MVLGYLSHILADMLTPAGVPALLAMPLAFFSLAILLPQKGNQLERFICMASCRVGMDAPFITRATALFVGHRK